MASHLLGRLGRGYFGYIRHAALAVTVFCLIAVPYAAIRATSGIKSIVWLLLLVATIAALALEAALSIRAFRILLASEIARIDPEALRRATPDGSSLLRLGTRIVSGIRRRLAPAVAFSDRPH